MIKEQIHDKLVSKINEVEEWFKSKKEVNQIPIYSSYDIRDSGFKVTNVDANIYPAGFNNICPTDQEHAPEAMRNYIDRHYGKSVQKILLLTEEHTNNPYYWSNIASLKKIMTEADLEVQVAIPRAKGSGKIEMLTATNEKIDVCPAYFENQQITACEFKSDLIVSNNDFSEYYAEWGSEILSPMNPPRELGWYQRKKSNYFKFYNEVATEFANLIDIDPWSLTVDTELFAHFDLADDQGKEQLAEKVAQLLERTKEKYLQHKIEGQPFAFIKNNSGTYGLGVVKVASADEVRNLNYKSRKKMKAAKGGKEVEEVIIQEGVPSITRAEGVTAEPAIYLIGCELAGGFLRTHADKDETESLNSPGAIYKRLCVSDLNISVADHPLENVYGCIARLGLLAIGRETEFMKVSYKGYIK
jgi:glutamate--cysteine ligase